METNELFTHDEFKRIPNHFYDADKFKNKRVVINEEGYTLEDYEPINWSRIGLICVLVPCFVFLVVVGVRIIFNI